MSPVAQHTDTARNATLEDLVALLRNQQTRRHDLVVPATNVRARDGQLVIKGAEQELTEDGVTTVDGAYRPTRYCDNQIADKLGIPQRYLTQLREKAPDLYDANVNGLLRGRSVRRADGTVEVIRPGDERNFLLRTFSDGNGAGVARALLSDTYKTIDNIDTVFSVLDGVRKAGVNVEITNCDLSDSRMYVDIHAPEVAALAPVLLGGYRNPFADPAVQAQRQHGRDADYWRGVAAREGQGFERGAEPVVFAGIRVSNSEVGGGAFSIKPKLRVKICRNGLVIEQDVIRAVHLGAKLDEGIVRWSPETQDKQLALITAKAADAVRTFLDADYLRRVLVRIEEKAGRPVDKPTEVVKVVGKTLGFTQAEQDGILDHFIRGGQLTAGGVVNAITSYSQTVTDADRADELDNQALRVLAIA